MINASASIFARAEQSPDAPAVVDEFGTSTWSEVSGSVTAAAGGLQELAARPGDRWAVLGDNAAPTLLAHAAGLTAGVGTTAVSRQLTASELAYQFKDAGIVAAITGLDGLSAVLGAAEHVDLRLVVVHGGPAPASASVPVAAWQDWLDGAPAMTAPQERSAAPMLVYTSGTTGRPRGTEVRWVPGNHATAAGYLDALIEQSHMPDGPHLVVGPLQHNGPLTAVRHLLTGQPVVILGRFDAQKTLAAIERHGVTSSVMVPTHLQRLLGLPVDVREGYDVSSLQLLSHTGSACPAWVKHAMIEWVGPVLVESYGGSEVGTLCRISSAEWLAHPGSVGRAVPPYEALVLDEQGAAVPPGTRGLLCFRAPKDRGISYLHDPEKTAAAYISPGVLTLGEIGHLDEAGYVYITDRAADLVVSGGVNLYPAESEQAIAAHPQVADVAVIGIPHADLGEQLLALVVPADRDHPPSAAELEAWTRQSLASYKCPKRFELVSELPRNAMNKLDKPAIRRPYLAADALQREDRR